MIHRMRRVMIFWLHNFITCPSHKPIGVSGMIQKPAFSISMRPRMCRPGPRVTPVPVGEPFLRWAELCKFCTTEDYVGYFFIVIVIPTRKSQAKVLNDACYPKKSLAAPKSSAIATATYLLMLPYNRFLKFFLLIGGLCSSNSIRLPITILNSGCFRTPDTFFVYSHL
jgi:hypothetical protein